MSSESRRWRTRIVLVLLAAVVIPVGASILYVYSPAEYSYVPCMFNKITGLHCPGCGATRCVHALLHGDLEQALAYNALFVILSPWLAYAFLRMAYEAWTGRRARRIRVPAWGITILFSVLILFWIARNIDVYPLNLLAPHTL
jgi:hypothetical protein